MPIKELVLASGETYKGECSEHLYGDMPNGRGVYQKDGLKRIGVHHSQWTVVPKIKPRLCVYPVGNVIQWFAQTYQAIQYDGVGKELSRKTTVFSEPKKDNFAGKVDYLVFYPVLNIQKALELTISYQQAPWDDTQVRVYHAHLGDVDTTTFSANGPGLRFVSLKNGHYLERVEGEFVRGQFIKGVICKEFRFSYPSDQSSTPSGEDAAAVEQRTVSCRHLVSGEFIDFKLNGMGETSISCFDVAKVNADANPPIPILSQFVSVKGVWNQGVYQGLMTFVLANGAKIACQYQNNIPIGIITLESSRDGLRYAEAGDTELEYLFCIGEEQTLGYKIRNEPVEAWLFLVGLVQKGYHELFRFCLQYYSFESLVLIHQKLLTERHLQAANACFAVTVGVIKNHRHKFEVPGGLVSDGELINVFTAIHQDDNVPRSALYQCVPFIIELLNPARFSFETCRQLSLFIPNMNAPCPTKLKENRKKAALQEFKKQFEIHSLPWIIERFRLMYEPQRHLQPQSDVILRVCSFFQSMDIRLERQVTAIYDEEVANRTLLESIEIDGFCKVKNGCVRESLKISQLLEKRMQTVALEKNNILQEESITRQELVIQSRSVFDSRKKQFNLGYDNIKASQQRQLAIAQEMIQLQKIEYAKREYIKIEQEEQWARQQLKTHSFSFFKTQKKQFNDGFDNIKSWRERCIAFSRPPVSELLFDIPLFLNFLLLDIEFYAVYHEVEKLDEKVLHVYQYLILMALKSQNSLLGEPRDAHEHELLQAEPNKELALLREPSTVTADYSILESKGYALMAASAENYVQGLLLYLEGGIINKENILCHVPVEFVSNMKMTEYFYRLVIRELVRRGAPFNTDTPRPNAVYNEIYLVLGESAMMEWDCVTNSYSLDSPEWIALESAAKQYVHQHVRVIPNYLVEEKSQSLACRQNSQ